ncbi:MAG: hypothetical protein L0L22_05835 [Staphylococcus equorum]|uniref:hypothetical protein n=1 Tax=Staphylococcus TaxID=1279 RepID=UPI00255485E6|nr:hypothetical protein [Staphylococcus equorum]MDK9870050.1 hypothetical protein [Staphylococcus equorum]MDK9870643.1 hypothetical protein [Staphylococcus equorum]MDK9876041.1 hypothetical protein [Staphylococcus equorum]MDN6570505.1 hypothetical protein [Staphylococcus equorum]MDN6751069.1 hypothetical protein [Staphylococcus equorum]
MNEDKNKLSQEDLLKIVWKDIYRLLGDISRTFNLIFNVFVVVLILIALVILCSFVIFPLLW